MNLFKYSIGQRERHFRSAVMEHNEKILMLEDDLLNFMDHYSQETTINKEPVMLFEKEKKKNAFDISKRMATWKRRAKSYAPKSNGKKYRDYWDQFYAKTLSDQEFQEYKKHLLNLGWKHEFQTSSGQYMWIKP